MSSRSAVTILYDAQMSDGAGDCKVFFYANSHEFSRILVTIVKKKNKLNVFEINLNLKKKYFRKNY